MVLFDRRLAAGQWASNLNDKMLPPLIHNTAVFPNIFITRPVWTFYLSCGILLHFLDISTPITWLTFQVKAFWNSSVMFDNFMKMSEGKRLDWWTKCPALGKRAKCQMIHYLFVRYHDVLLKRKPYSLVIISVDDQQVPETQLYQTKCQKKCIVIIIHWRLIGKMCGDLSSLLHIFSPERQLWYLNMWTTLISR